MPVDWSKYPKNWSQYIRPAILKRAANRCEGSPAYPLCRAANKRPHPVTKSKVVLTVAHMDHDTDNNDGMEDFGPALPLGRANLRALCQRCHLTHDARQHAENAAKTREANRRASEPMLPGMDADGGSKGMERRLAHLSRCRIGRRYRQAQRNSMPSIGRIRSATWIQAHMCGVWTMQWRTRHKRWQRRKERCNSSAWRQ